MDDLNILGLSSFQVHYNQIHNFEEKKYDNVSLNCLNVAGAEGC